MGDEFHLGPMSLAAASLAREWRNRPDVRPGLRTALMLTENQQDEWYQKVVCDRRADSRWWAVGAGVETLAVAGLTGIQPENGLAEISLIVSPEYRGGGLGSESVSLILAEAFDRMRLVTIFGECYLCNGDAANFWMARVAAHRSGQHSLYIPRRKFWDGKLWDALLFCFTVEGWRAAQQKGQK